MSTRERPVRSATDAQRVLRQVAVLRLDLLQDRDQPAPLAPVLVDDLADLGHGSCLSRWRRPRSRSPLRSWTLRSPRAAVLLSVRLAVATRSATTPPSGRRENAAGAVAAARAQVLCSGGAVPALPGLPRGTMRRWGMVSRHVAAMSVPDRHEVSTRTGCGYRERFGAPVGDRESHACRCAGGRTTLRARRPTLTRGRRSSWGEVAPAGRIPHRASARRRGQCVASFSRSVLRSMPRISRPRGLVAAARSPGRCGCARASTSASVRSEPGARAAPRSASAAAGRGRR